MAADEGHRLTEQRLTALEERISETYSQAANELGETIAAYFESFRERDEEMLESVEKGEVTLEHYKQWRLNQIARGKRYEALRDKLAGRMTDTTETALSYINDTTPGIYSLNRNYAAYTIEQISDDADFTIYNEQAVKRIVKESPTLMPHYPERLALKRGIDLKYGQSQITKNVVSSILQGKGIKKMADDLQHRIADMSRASAIRTARTAITNAQNAGRQDQYTAAAAMGIKLKKRWVATLDGRTRHAHGMADGQTVDIDADFEVDGYKMAYPGDRRAPGYLLYNCRCTMRTVEPEGIEAEPRQRRVKDPETGENVLVSDMTYQEWLKWKESTKSVANTENSDIIEEKVGKGGNSVLEIGKIDIEKYRGVTDGTIRSDVLVLTENQKEHIIKRRGADFYEKYSQYFADIAKDPDYIFADTSHANTALASKTLIDGGKNIHLVIRLALVEDTPGIENSIITAIVEGDKRYQQRLRNKIPLYKKE